MSTSDDEIWVNFKFSNEELGDADWPVFATFSEGWFSVDFCSVLGNKGEDEAGTAADAFSAGKFTFAFCCVGTFLLGDNDEDWMAEATFSVGNFSFVFCSVNEFALGDKGDGGGEGDRGFVFVESDFSEGDIGLCEGFWSRGDDEAGDAATFAGDGDFLVEDGDGDDLAFDDVFVFEEGEGDDFVFVDDFEIGDCCGLAVESDFWFDWFCCGSEAGDEAIGFKGEDEDVAEFVFWVDEVDLLDNGFALGDGLDIEDGEGDALFLGDVVLIVDDVSCDADALFFGVGVVNDDWVNALAILRVNCFDGGVWTLSFAVFPVGLEGNDIFDWLRLGEGGFGGEFFSIEIGFPFLSACVVFAFEFTGFDIIWFFEMTEVDSTFCNAGGLGALLLAGIFLLMIYANTK